MQTCSNPEQVHLGVDCGLIWGTSENGHVMFLKALLRFILDIL
jgi:hypothetical protein